MACFSFRAIALRLACGAVVLVAGAAGAEGTGDERALRDRQEVLFERMLETPDDVELMFEHAAVSIRLGDYEAAIATLERLLVYRRDLSRVRLELGVAYFNLGSYAAAELYLGQAAADPELPEASRERVERYRAAISARTARNAFSMVANLGLTYSTNANLAPQDNTLVIGGVPGFELEPDARSDDDFGLRLFAYGRHGYDLRRPNSDAWLTDFSVFGLKYFEVSRGDTLFARLRTGPNLSLGAAGDAPAIRPYAEGQYLFGEDERVFFAGLAGLEAGRPLSRKWRGFVDANVGLFDFTAGRNDQDRVAGSLLAGGAYAPNRNFLGRVALLGGYEDADADYNTNLEMGARATVSYAYDSGLGAVDDRWRISGYADLRYRWYDSADPFIDPDETREDFDLRLGASHLFSIREGFGFQLDVEGLIRDSSISNYDLDNFTITLSAQYRL